MDIAKKRLLEKNVSLKFKHTSFLLSINRRICPQRKTLAGLKFKLATSGAKENTSKNFYFPFELKLFRPKKVSNTASTIAARYFSLVLTDGAQFDKIWRLVLSLHRTQSIVFEPLKITIK